MRFSRILLSLSLLVSLASALLWPLSFFWSGRFAAVGRASVSGASISGGRITFMLQHGAGTAELVAKQPVAAGFWEFRNAHDRTHYFDFNEYWRETLRFRWRSEVMTLKSGATTESSVFAVPLWFPASLCAIAPALANRRQRARLQRIRDGLCVQCGYDLRASVDRCPECGAMPERLPETVA